MPRRATRRVATHAMQAQRRTHDCGVAALASYFNIAYEEIFVAAVAQSRSFAGGAGLSIPEMIAIAKAFGRKLERVHYRQVDLEEHSGILGVNWDRSMWKQHGGTGHWVLLRTGTILDPVGFRFADATDYLTLMKGRVGTLLRES